MQTNLHTYREDLDRLVEKGDELLSSLVLEFRPDLISNKSPEEQKKVKANLPKFKTSYQSWYSEAMAVVKQLIPDRLSDFIRHYERPKVRKSIDSESYRIEDCLLGLSVTRGYNEQKVVDGSAAIPHFQQQLSILASAQRRLESSLFDIRQLVQADLFDSELESAREIVKAGFLRGAGAVAGVVLEKHLGQVAANHNLTCRKGHPTISDFNDLLKQASVVDTPVWRGVQRLGDLRNLCDHGKDREPTKEEVLELIDGTEKIMKTLF